MASGYSFRPRAWAFALTAAACAAFIALGNWQARRADEKRALGAELEKKRVVLSGDERGARRGGERERPGAGTERVS